MDSEEECAASLFLYIVKVTFHRLSSSLHALIKISFDSVFCALVAILKIILKSLLLLYSF